jgi:type I restriction enzyme S subunit
MENIATPKIIYSNDLKNKNYSLSPWLYSKVNIYNKNIKKLSEILDDDLTTKYLGKEISRKSYINNSDYYFLTTRALNEDFFTLDKYSQSEIPMNPKKFKKLNLQKNNIIIAKDAKPGEVVILDKDYPNHMLSGGMYKLPLYDDIFYYFSILKSKFFKDQLNAKVPRGATLKHAGKLFLDCLIPIATESQKKLLSNLTQSIILKENMIRKKQELTNETILNHLTSNSNELKKCYPRINEIMNENRIDTGIYTHEFKMIESLLKNYKNSYFCLDKKKIQIGSTPKKRLIDENLNLKFNWITPDYISDFGTLIKKVKINCDKANIKKNSVLIINRTSKAGLGQYVGISNFYDFKKYGYARCNQGIYILSDFSDEDLIFITSFLNSKLMRSYCGNVSLGAKMKEMKSFHFSKIPFPNFDAEIKKKIINYYYQNLDYEININNFDLESDQEFNKKAGILDLQEAIIKTKNIISDQINILTMKKTNN